MAGYVRGACLVSLEVSSQDDEMVGSRFCVFCVMRVIFCVMEDGVSRCIVCPFFVGSVDLSFAGNVVDDLDR